jgi:hypothetical protein
MSSEPPAGGRPAPVVLRVKLRYASVDEFVERFAVNVGRAGVFLASKTARAPGTEIRFELKLADDTPVVVGVGVVRSARLESAGPPKVTAGLVVAFTRVTPESRAVLRRMLDVRRARGLSDDVDGMPLFGAAAGAPPARAATTGVAEDHGAGAATAAEAAPAPALDDAHAPVATTTPPAVPEVAGARRATSPTGRPPPRRARARASEAPPTSAAVTPSDPSPLAHDAEPTSARRGRTRPPPPPRARTTSHPPPLGGERGAPPRRLDVPLPTGDLLPAAEPHAAAPSPSPTATARPPRPRRSLDELVASAAAAAVAIQDDFDSEAIDVAAVVARARALAGADLDAELGRLTGSDGGDTAAAPASASDASAQLTRLLGGAAIPIRPPRRRPRRTSAPPPASAPPGLDEIAASVATSPARDVDALPPGSSTPVEPDQQPASPERDALDATVDTAQPAEGDLGPMAATLDLSGDPATLVGVVALPDPAPVAALEHEPDRVAEPAPTPEAEPGPRYERAATSVSDDLGLEIAFEAATDLSLPHGRERAAPPAPAPTDDVEVGVDDLDGTPTGVSAETLLATDDDFYIPAAALSGAAPLPLDFRPPTPGPARAVASAPAPADTPFPPDEDTTGVISPAPHTLGRIRLAKAPASEATRARKARVAPSPRIPTAPVGLDDALDSLDVDVSDIETPAPRGSNTALSARAPQVPDRDDVTSDATDDVQIDLDDLEP